MSYHFGCCMACRAPFLPDTSLFYQEESQAVFYMQARFKQISTPKSNSDFTGRRESSHLLSRSHFSQAVMFASRINRNRVFRDIVGWNDDPQLVVLNQGNSFFLTKTKLDNIVDKKVADQGANVEAMLVQHAKTSLAEFERNAANQRLRGANLDQYNEKLVEDLIKNIATTTANTFFAAWKAPQPTVQHSGLRAWLAANLRNLNSLKVDLDFTTPCCSLCNDIWDCWARMRQVLAESGIVPIHSMVVQRRTKNGQSIGVESKVLPVEASTRNSKSLHQQRMGCLAAYYLHASLASICNQPGAPAGTPPGIDLPGADQPNENIRKLISMLLWLPMHITCMYMEMQEGPLVQSSAKKNKGQHNYTGCIDLSISYYLWLIARAHNDIRVDFPFDKFSTLYVKEIVECPAPVWDAEEHPHLHSYIFDETRPALEMVAETVAHVSNRLVLLYTEKIAPLVPYMKGGDVDSPDPDFKAKAASYFIGSRECAALMSRYNTTGANADDIRYFIEYAGIAGVLWQMRRYLANEPEAFQAQLDQWMSAVMVREWHNIADNSPEEISLLEAQLIYNMQNALTPEALTGGGAELGTGVEISLLRAMDEDAIKEIIEETGRCSIWKAAARLRKWQFTRSSALRAGDASDMAMGTQMQMRVARSMGTQMQMRVASLKPRAVVLVDTGEGDLGKVQSHAAACRLALSIGPAYMRSPTPCALSARLISARLASTPAMSTDEGDAHGAGRGRAASRRGCRGRGNSEL